jgi:hypothetical protein
MELTTNQVIELSIIWGPEMGVIGKDLESLEKGCDNLTKSVTRA